MSREEKAIEAEILLSALLAFSFILLSIIPSAGRIICLVSLGLFTLFYVMRSLLLLTVKIRENHHARQDVINFMGVAIALVILTFDTFLAENRFLLEIIAILIPVICLVLNFVWNRHYVNGIQYYAIIQIRMMILLALALILNFALKI